jgi:putative flippase GtrA
MTFSPKSDPGHVRVFFGQGLRFVTVGMVNAVGTLILYELLLFVMPYMPAYVFSWFAGLLFVNVAYPRFVYRKAAVTRREAALNSMYYVVSFAVSWGLLHLFTEEMGIRPRLSMLCVLAIVVPMNFLVTRGIYRSRPV